MSDLSLVALVFGNPILKACVALLAANLLAGVALSLWNRHNVMPETCEWIISRALPYLLIGVMVELVVLNVPPEWTGLVGWTDSAVWTVVFGLMAHHAWTAVKETGLDFTAPAHDSPVILERKT